MEGSIMRPETEQLSKDVMDYAKSRGVNVSLEDLYGRFGCRSEEDKQRVRNVASQLCGKGHLSKVMVGVYTAEKKRDDASIRRMVPSILPPLDGWLLNLIRTSGKSWKHMDLLQRAGAYGHKVRRVPAALSKLVSEGKLVNPGRGIYCVPATEIPEEPETSDEVQARASVEQEETIKEIVLRTLKENDGLAARATLMERITTLGKSEAALTSELARLKKQGTIVSPRRGMYALPDTSLSQLPEPAPTAPRTKKGSGGRTHNKLADRLAKTRKTLERARAKRDRLKAEVGAAQAEVERIEGECEKLANLASEAEALAEKIAAALGG